MTHSLKLRITQGLSANRKMQQAALEVLDHTVMGDTQGPVQYEETVMKLLWTPTIMYLESVLRQTASEMAKDGRQILNANNECKDEYKKMQGQGYSRWRVTYCCRGCQSRRASANHEH